MEHNQVLLEAVADWFEVHSGFELSLTLPTGDNFFDTSFWAREWGVDQIELEEEIVRQASLGEGVQQ